mgnify:CR=1 FL=1
MTISVRQSAIADATPHAATFPSMPISGNLLVAFAEEPRVRSVGFTSLAALEWMKRENVRRFPVVEEGKLVGAITRFDILRVIQANLRR